MTAPAPCTGDSDCPSQTQPRMTAVTGLIIPSMETAPGSSRATPLNQIA